MLTKAQAGKLITESPLEQAQAGRYPIHATSLY